MSGAGSELRWQRSLLAARFAGSEVCWQRGLLAAKFAGSEVCLTRCVREPELGAAVGRRRKKEKTPDSGYEPSF